MRVPQDFTIHDQTNVKHQISDLHVHVFWYTQIVYSVESVRSKAVVLLLLTFCLLLLPLWESVIVLCFVVRYFMPILVLQSSWWGRESWLLCLICLPGVSWWLSGSSSQCHRVVCVLWLWYFLIILTYCFCYHFYNIRHMVTVFAIVMGNSLQLFHACL